MAAYELQDGGRQAGRSIPLDREERSRWSVIVAYGLLAAATQTLLVNYAAVTHDAAHHFGVSISAIGWLAEIFVLVYVILAIPAGLVLDRYFRPGLIAGAALTAGGAFLRLGGDSYSWALIGQVVAAVGQPFVLNGITGLVVVYLVKKDRTTGIAAASAATFFGMVVGFAAGAALPGAHNVRTLTLVTALIALAAAAYLIVALAMVRPLATSMEEMPTTGGLRSFRAAWGNPHLRRLCVVVVIPMGTFIALTTYAQPLLEPAGVSEATAGIILALTTIAGVIGCAVVPVWAEKRDRELNVIAVGITVTAIACLVLAVIPGVATGYLMMLAIGMALLPALPIVLALTERHAPDAEGTAAGLIWLAGNLGGVVVTTIVGILVHHSATAFIVLAGVTALVLPALRWYGRLEQRQP
ncbi:MAG: MFS transporter [Nocardioides sp.]|uniref:MFS transporter n=1 Tax=Nocardioides sp. TaxID=35761 RepID=UPI0039E44BFC